MAVRDETCAEAGPGGRWEYRGPVAFPIDKNLPCDAYRWHADPSLGRFQIDFVSPPDETPRRFFAAEWLRELAAASSPGKRSQRGRGTAGRYVERVTRRGIPCLRQLEQMIALRAGGGGVVWNPPKGFYEFSHALFRRRQDGHYAVRRVFGSRYDFLDVGAAGGEKVLVPEMNWPDAEQVSDIIRGIEASCASGAAAGAPAGPWPVETLPGRNGLDMVLTDGATWPLPVAELGGLWNQVSAALIDDFHAFSGRPCVACQADRRTFVERLMEAHRTKNCHDFDRWFRVEREKGFVRLLGRGADPRVAGDLFRRLLWESYVQMGRAYGAVMLAAWTGFRSSPEIRPDGREQELFRTMHMPQIALAGLPVAFLPYGLVHWLLPTILERFWGEPAAGPDDVLVLARMVARYADLNAVRRPVDRRRSTPAKKTVPVGAGNEPVVQPADVAESYDHLPRVGHNRCFKCGGVTAPRGKAEPYRGDCVFPVECLACGDFSTRRLQGG